MNTVNLSLMTDFILTSFKTAVVKPQLQKPHLDPVSLNNHPHFSNLLLFLTFSDFKNNVINKYLFEPFKESVQLAKTLRQFF